ncbi:MAG: hypothetical protein LBL58_14295 [Tannerellaceae bacterium]|jgi:hypothetical protein|nr:hypothetical protein [Tannerellaceae bacterium]
MNVVNIQYINTEKGASLISEFVRKKADGLKTRKTSSVYQTTLLLGGKKYFIVNANEAVEI